MAAPVGRIATQPLDATRKPLDIVHDRVLGHLGALLVKVPPPRGTSVCYVGALAGARRIWISVKRPWSKPRRAPSQWPNGPPHVSVVGVR